MDTEFRASELFAKDFEATPMLLPPSLISEFVFDLSSASSALGAIKAVDRFLKFWRMCVNFHPNRMTPERLSQINTNVDACRTVAHDSKRQLEGTAQGFHLAAKEARIREKHLSVRSRDLLELMRSKFFQGESKERMNVWRESKSLTFPYLEFMRSEWLDRLLTELLADGSLEAQLGSGELSPAKLRDICMALLLVTCGGHRGVVLRKLSLKEWREAEFFGDPRGRQEMVVRVRHHKTFDSSGSAVLVVRRPRIRALIQQYLAHARPLLDHVSRLTVLRKFVLLVLWVVFPQGDGEDDEESDGGSAPVFPSGKTGKATSKVAGAMAWLRSAMTRAGVTYDPDPQLKGLTSQAIRNCYSNFGQRHQDSDVRKFMAKHQKHQQQTADSQYRIDEDAEVSRKVAGVVDDALFGEVCVLVQ